MSVFLLSFMLIGAVPVYDVVVNAGGYCTKYINFLSHLKMAKGLYLNQNAVWNYSDDSPWTFGGALPDQTGNEGKVLTTDGTNLSWAFTSTGFIASLSAIYYYDSDVTINAALNGAIISNKGALQNINCTFAPDLPAGFHVGFANQVGLTGGTFFSDAIGTDDLRAVWHFNNGAFLADAKGDNDITNIGGVLEDIGLSGNCASFPTALDAYLTVPHHADIRYNGNEFILSIWLKPTADSLTTGNHEILGMAGSHVMRQNSDGTVYAYFYDGSGNFKEVTSTTLLSSTAWTHVIMCKIDGFVKLYINGVSEGTPVAITGAWATTSNMILGSYFATADYQGLMDEIGIWNNTDITDTDMTAMAAALYNSGTGRFFQPTNSSTMNIIPASGEQIPYTAEIGNEVLSSAKDDFIEYLKTADGWIGLSVFPAIGSWVDQL